jgi:hypothetical protein
MPYDPYDDPEINTPDDDYPDQVRFERVGDSVRGRVLSVEKITTRYGPTLKYMLFDGNVQKSLLAGGKNLKAQMIELRPRPGDVIDVKLIELRTVSQGTAKIYDVEIERGNVQTLAPPPPAPAQRQEQVMSDGVQTRPDPGRAPAPRPIQSDDEPDLFDK